MKCINELLKTNSNYKRIGNHRKEREGHITKYYYHYTPIVVVDDLRKTFKTNNGGWGTISTTRAINAYRRELLSIGFRELIEA